MCITDETIYNKTKRIYRRGSVSGGEANIFGSHKIFLEVIKHFCIAGPGGQLVTRPGGMMEGLMSDAETILGQGSQHQHQQRHMSIEAAGDTGTVQSMEVGSQ